MSPTFQFKSILYFFLTFHGNIQPFLSTTCFTSYQLTLIDFDIWSS